MTAPLISPLGAVGTGANPLPILTFPTVAALDAYTTAQDGQLGYTLDIRLFYTWNAGNNAWMILGTERTYYSPVQINGLATAGTSVAVLTIPQVGANRFFYPRQVTWRVQARTATSIGTQPTISLGSTSGGSDIASASLLSTLLASSTLPFGSGVPPVNVSSPKLSPGTVIYATVNVPAVGVGLTAYAVSVDLTGGYNTF